MKPRNIILGITALASSMAAAAGNEPADTIAHVTDALSVTLTESPGSMNLAIMRDQQGDTITELIIRDTDNAVVSQRHWNRTLHSIPAGPGSRFDLCIGGPGIGWINAVGQPHGLGIEMGKSLEISWLNMISVKYHMPYFNLSIGFGLDWRNYRISTSASRFIPTESGTVDVAPYPEGSTTHGSRLKIFTMGIPVIWTQSLPFKWIDGSRFNISAGAVFNYSPHGSLLTKWTGPDGKEAVQKSDHIGHRRFSIDFIGMMKLGWGLHAYVRYSPHTVLRGSGQPRFRPFSTGLMFMY